MIGRSAKDILIHIKGDDKDFQGAIRNSDKSMGTFASKMQQYGPMIGAAFVTAAAGFVAMSVKMAATEEAVSRQTEALLKSQGLMWRAVDEDLNAYMKDLERLTAFNDTDLQQAFNTMLAAGMSYTDAMESMNTVTSMSYSLNRDLASMALLVGKAYNGQTGELSRYGIILDDTLSKTEKFSGLQAYVANNMADAAERTDSLEGQMQTLNNEMSNFAEAMGAELIPATTGFISALNSMGIAGQELGTTFGRFLTLPWDLPAQLGEHTANMITMNKLRKSGVDTEEELVSLLRLQSDQLVGMSDAEFERKMQLMEIFGFTDKMSKLEMARAYGLRQILDVEREITTESQKQLTIEEKKAAYLAKYSQSEAMRARKAGISLGALGIEGETRKSGQWTIGPSVASTRSGV